MGSVEQEESVCSSSGCACQQSIGGTALPPACLMPVAAKWVLLTDTVATDGDYFLICWELESLEGPRHEMGVQEIFLEPIYVLDKKQMRGKSEHRLENNRQKAS